MNHLKSATGVEAVQNGYTSKVNYNSSSSSNGLNVTAQLTLVMYIWEADDRFVTTPALLLHIHLYSHSGSCTDPRNCYWGESAQLKGGRFLKKKGDEEGTQSRRGGGGWQQKERKGKFRYYYWVAKEAHRSWWTGSKELMREGGIDQSKDRKKIIMRRKGKHRRRKDEMERRCSVPWQANQTEIFISLCLDGYFLCL